VAVVRLGWDAGELHEIGPSQIQDRSRTELALPDLGLDNWLESRRVA
jgi:hypothetical protein